MDKRHFNQGRPRQEVCIKGHNNWGPRKTGARYCKTCRLEWNTRARKEIRVQILLHYGGRCACCGENRYEFLSLDHIVGGGSKHRKAINRSGGWNFYQWIKINNYPEGFQVLCHNCNLSKGFYGKCPHEIEREAASKDISEYYRQLSGWDRSALVVMSGA